MSGWDGYSSGSGAEHEPSEERGQAAWSGGQSGAVPPWASAETQAGQSPPPWASAETHTNGARPPTWPPPPPPPPPGAGHSPVPTTVPTPQVAPARRRGAGNLLIALAVVAVLGAGTGAGVWYLTRDNSTGTGAGPATSVSVTVTTTPSQSATPSPTPTASASTLASPSASPSVGYRRAQDPIGYAVDVPQGWTRRQKQGELAPVVYYDSPGGDRQLQIFEVTEKTPYASLQLAENDPGFGFSRQPGYQVLERDRGDTWAELSYRYDDEDKGARQVIDHRFRAADGTLYAIRSSGPEGLDPDLVREPLAMAVGSFCPSGAECG
ncbi:hypothetical protein [Streptomyces sp. NPDC047043]|uniref:hypothetical protein n=1 Tax=Streptomyces sp. NPDC047043 TaxID=3154497 RepID=UPI0033FC429A